IGVASAQQQQCGQDAAHTAVAVLKRMDFKEYADENGYDQQRMQLPALQFFPCPTDYFSHQARGVERRSRFKHQGDVFSSLVKGRDAVRLGLVFAAMM